MTQATITTITVEFSQAQIIRCVARQDMPEAGIKEGQVIYLTRSSKNDGTYYIATWNYERMQWDCRCPATKPCRHMKLMSQDCKQPHTLQGFKPATRGEKFALLLVKYDIRFQSPVIEAEEVAEVASRRYDTSEVQATPRFYGNICVNRRERARDYDVAEQARWEVMTIEERMAYLRERREQAPLNGRQGFQLMR